MKSTKLTRLSTIVGMTAILLVMSTVVAAQERISYTSTVDNKNDVWSMKTDGSDPKRLTGRCVSKDATEVVC